MHRIYSNYTDEEFNTIEEEANKAGMTISAFCKAAVIAKVSGKTDNFSIDLIKILHKKLRFLSYLICIVRRFGRLFHVLKKIPYLNN